MGDEQHLAVVTAMKHATHHVASESKRMPSRSRDGDRDCEEIENLLRETIALHIQGLQEDGLAIPEPSSVVEYLDLEAST